MLHFINIVLFKVSPKSSFSAMLLAGMTFALMLAASEAAANGNGADTCAKHVEYRDDLLLKNFIAQITEYRPEMSRMDH